MLSSFLHNTNIKIQETIKVIISQIVIFILVCIDTIYR